MVTSKKIQDSMNFTRNVLEEKTVIHIDQPSSDGRTHGGVKIIQNKTKKTVNSLFHADYTSAISVLFTASEN